jgi:uncharacterized protein YjiS (DUF1127 family)
MYAGRGGSISLGVCISVLKAWSERYRQRRQLADLDDHMLRDLGLSHREVTWECNKPFWWR